MRAADARTRTVWARKLQRLVEAQETAGRDVFVGIHEAREAGLTLADIAHAIGTHSTGVPAKVAKGKMIAERRKRT